MQIQNFDPGMAALRPMATAQEMDIRAAQEARAREEHPYQLKRLAALSEWDVTRAAEKRAEIESDANLARYLQDFKPSKEGLPHEVQLAEMSAGLLRQGRVNEAKKLADLSIGVLNAAAMQEQREATAEMRRARAQQTQYAIWNQTLSAIDGENAGMVFERLKQQGMPQEDLVQMEGMAFTTDVMGRKVPNPRGIATLQGIARSFRESMAVQQKAEAQKSLDAFREEKLKQGEQALRLQAARVNISANLANLAAIRTAAYTKLAGKMAPEASSLDIKQAAALIASDEELMSSVDMSPQETFSFASAVAERAKAIRHNSKGALSADEALAKAKDEVTAMLVKKPDGKIVTWMTELFGPEVAPKPKLTFRGPPKAVSPQPNITKEEYDRLPKGAKFWWNGKEVVKGN